MHKFAKPLLKNYYEKNSLVESDTASFNEFIEKGLHQIIEENKIIEPTIIPQNIDDFKIKLDKIWVGQPEITEADGSKRAIFPVEARLRKISYAAPVYIEVSAHINDVQRESFVTQIGNLPIMLKSKFCHLHGLNREQLIEKGEDPDDPGGYFIVNGTEKVLIDIEDLAANKLLVEEANSGISEYVGKIFSEHGNYKIPHQIERLKDGIFYLSFTRVKRVPVIVMIKALGMVKDEEIMRAVSKDQHYEEVLINLFEFVDIKKDEDAVDYVAKKIGITQTREIRLERMYELLDKYLLPHLGTTPEAH